MLDYIFRNIDVADGSGSPMYHSSVGIKDGKIAVIAKTITEEAKEVIDGQQDWVLAPGFIDTHTHNDSLVFMDPTEAPQLLQGITYEIAGSCGVSVAPVNPKFFKTLKEYNAPLMSYTFPDEQWLRWTTFGKYLEELKSTNHAIGNGNLIGHGTLRLAVMEMENRKPTAAEMDEMKALLREAMEAGAIGLSSGLIYPPGVYSDKEELTELCKVVAEYDGVYSTHMRNESDRVLEGIQEAIDIGMATGCKVLISHHKVLAGNYNELQREAYRMMCEARANGLRLINDQYMYNRGSTSMTALMPPYTMEKGSAGLLELLKDPAARDKIRENISTDQSWENFLLKVGADNVLVIRASVTDEYNGRSIEDIAKEQGIDPIDCAMDLIAQNNADCIMAVEFCTQEVVDKIFLSPYTAIGSDGIGAGNGKLSHPRAYANCVKVFSDCVRERKLVTLEEAVRKCTSLPADFLGLNKGHIQKGYDADLVIFNRETIGSKSDFVNPIQKPEGIEYVFVNGQLKLKHGVIL